jgi:anthranilate synthase component 2
LAEAHQQYDVRGVQFHPEAYLTQHGLQMIKNWMK